MITVCAIISGCTSYYDFEAFGHERSEWLRTFLELENGIPSHDTFRRFWTNCEPARMNALFMEWVDGLTDESLDGDGVHIDGKCLRRALTEDGRQPCIVSAYSSTETTSGHGRVEKRTCWQTDYLDWFQDKPKWAGLNSVCMIESERTIKKTGNTTTERRFFISSLPVNPKKALHVAVQH